MTSIYNPAETMSAIDNILEEVSQLKEVVLHSQAKFNSSPWENPVPLTLSQQIKMGLCHQSMGSQPTTQHYMTYIRALNKKITEQKEENKKMKEKMKDWRVILKSEGYDECKTCGSAIPNVGGGHLCLPTTKCIFTR